MRLRGLAAVGAAFLGLWSMAASGEDLAAAFGARPQLRSVSLSPDGKRLAYLVPQKGQGSALLTYAPGIDKAPSVALRMNGEPDRISDCNWITNDRLVCTLWGVTWTPQTLLAGDVTYSRIVAIDANGGNPQMLSPQIWLYGGAIIDLLPDGDGSVLIARDGRGTVEKLDTRTLATTVAEKGRPDAASYLTDGHGTVRIMDVERIEANKTSGNRRVYYRTAGDTRWQVLTDYNYANETGFEPCAVDYERNAVYGFRKKDGRKAVYRMALDGSMREELVFAHDQVDVDDLIYLGRRGRVVGATFVTDSRQTVYFDDDLAKLRDNLAKALPQQPQVKILDSSLDEKKLLILAGSDNDPGVYYLLDRTTRRMEIFQPLRPQLEGVPLARVKHVSYPASDGTMIPAYLTLPPQGTGQGLLAIVMPHGGPSARDEWGFDWMAQYYAARGFAVLQPNYRGSAGYGDGWFEENGFKSWQTAIGDILAGGHWLVGQGIGDPAKLGIVGWSYGGYAALQSAVVDPGFFKAVVAVAPVTDLARLKDQYKWTIGRKIITNFIGSGPHIDQGSPARSAARIKVPVLLFHGAQDINVDVDHSRSMAARLKEAGVPHRLVVFDKRDHQIDDSEMRAQILRDSDAFLRQSMGM